MGLTLVMIMEVDTLRITEYQHLTPFAFKNVHADVPFPTLI